MRVRRRRRRRMRRKERQVWKIGERFLREEPEEEEDEPNGEGDFHQMLRGMLMLRLQC